MQPQHCVVCVPFAELKLLNLVRRVFFRWWHIRALLNSLRHSSNVHKSRHTRHNQRRNYSILPFRFVRNTHNHSKIWFTYANPSDDNLWCISQQQQRRRQPHKKHPVQTEEKVMKIQAIRANSLDEREREPRKKAKIVKRKIGVRCGDGDASNKETVSSGVATISAHLFDVFNRARERTHWRDWQVI